MTELIVLYRMPNDPEHFEKYYREVHGPMTGKLPGVRAYKYGRVCALDGGTGEFFWYWSGTFDSRQAALDAMASPEGQAGNADVPNYYHDVPLFMFFERDGPSRVLCGPRNNKMNEIFWPEDYIPGFTDNFASNEVIVAGLSAVDVWPLLSKAPLWPTYYSNSANIRFYDGKGPELDDGVRFYFETFGFPVEAQVLEHVPPTEGKPGRLGWHGWGGKGDTRFDIYHAWLLEDLPGGRVRILTQESQKGKPAQELAKKKPNVMINGHQDWLDGLVAAAHKAKS